MVRSHGCGQKASVPAYAFLSEGLLGCFIIWPVLIPATCPAVRLSMLFPPAVGLDRYGGTDSLLWDLEVQGPSLQ